eukprot:gene21302-biopygen13183
MAPKAVYVWGWAPSYTGPKPYAWRRRPLPALRPGLSGVGAPAIRPRPMADRLTCSAGASLTPIPRTNAFRWRNGRQSGSA